MPDSSEYVDSLTPKSSESRKSYLSFKSSKLITLLIGFVVLLLLGYFSYKFILRIIENNDTNTTSSQVQPDGNSPVFPDSYVQSDAWKVNFVQPIFKEVKTMDGADYVVFDVEGKEYMGFLAGAFSSVELNSVNFFEGGKSEKLNSDIFDQYFNTGNQVGIKYLNAWPELTARTNETCQSVGNLCEYADMADALASSNVLIRDLTSKYTDLASDSVLIVQVYSELIKNEQQ